MPKLIHAPGELSPHFTRAQVLELAQEHAHTIATNDRYDLMRVFVEMKRYELYFKTLLNELKTEVGQRALIAKQEQFAYGTARMTCRRQAKYDYSADPYWTELGQRMQSLRNERKDWEARLRDLEDPIQEFADEESGEVHRAYRPVVEYVESVRVTVGGEMK